MDGLEIGDGRYNQDTYNSQSNRQSQRQAGRACDYQTQINFLVGIRDR